MIDLHSHVLPGIDDGARSPDETSLMLEQAVADGVDVIVATPHCSGAALGMPAEIKRHVEQAQRIARQRRLPITVLPGCELMLSSMLIDDDLESIRPFGLNGGRYLLVEFPGDIAPPNLEYVIARLHEAGFRLILAHTERYGFVRRDIDWASRLIRQGVLVQVNSTSFNGDGSAGAQRTARALVSEGLVDFLASDTHAPDDRGGGLTVATRIASKLVGVSAAEAMVLGNPEAVVADKPQLPSAPPIVRNRTYHFLPTSLLKISFGRRGRKPGARSATEL